MSAIAIFGLFRPDRPALFPLAFASAADASEAPAEAELAAGLNRGDPEALEDIYERYSRPVFSLLLRMTGERPMAEELLQEAFLRLWRKAGAFEPSRGAILPWLLTIARNLALDRIRSAGERQRSREDVPDVLPGADTGAAGEAWVDARRQADRVRAALAGFPGDQRRALELAYFEGMSHGEVAAAMERPLGTVKTWLRNGLLRMREQLGGAR
jgi:RNA polymerase sigma-70 factor (ECF subfamily)